MGCPPTPALRASVGWFRPGRPGGSQSEEVLKDVGQTFRVDRLSGASQLVDRPPPMSDDRGLLHVGPSHVGEGIAGSPDQKVGLLLVVGVSFEGPMEPAGKESGPRTSMSNPVSSAVSRTAAASSVSPSSTAPPTGNQTGGSSARVRSMPLKSRTRSWGSISRTFAQSLRTAGTSPGSRGTASGPTPNPANRLGLPLPHSAARWWPQAPCETPLCAPRIFESRRYDR